MPGEPKRVQPSRKARSEGDLRGAWRVAQRKLAGTSPRARPARPGRVRREPLGAAGLLEAYSGGVADGGGVGTRWPDARHLPGRGCVDVLEDITGGVGRDGGGRVVLVAPGVVAATHGGARRGLGRQRRTGSWVTTAPPTRVCRSRGHHRGAGRQDRHRDQRRGRPHVCGGRRQGVLLGLQRDGQLGNNSTTDSSVPVAVDTAGVAGRKDGHRHRRRGCPHVCGRRR